jgi:hypothetical protein
MGQRTLKKRLWVFLLELMTVRVLERLIENEKGYEVWRQKAKKLMMKERDLTKLTL